MKTETYLKALEEYANYIKTYLAYDEINGEPMSDKARTFWARKLVDIKDQIQEVEHFMKYGDIEWK